MVLVRTAVRPGKKLSLQSTAKNWQWRRCPSWLLTDVPNRCSSCREDTVADGSTQTQLLLFLMSLTSLYSGSVEQWVLTYSKTQRAQSPYIYTSSPNSQTCDLWAVWRTRWNMAYAAQNYLLGFSKIYQKLSTALFICDSFYHEKRSGVQYCQGKLSVCLWRLGMVVIYVGILGK